MRRYPSPLTLHAGGMAIVLVATIGVAWSAMSQGRSVSTIWRVASTVVDMGEAVPRMAIAALLVLGGYLLTRRNPQPTLTRVAAACAATGVLACLYMLVQFELSFSQSFPDGGVSGGWSPGAARAEFLTLPYLAALGQALFGLFASTLLLAILAVRRVPPVVNG